MFKIAFRNVFRNARRSGTTILTIAVGAAAMLVFAAYALYDVFVLQTVTVQRGGHLTVYAKGFFDFGSGDPAVWGIADYAAVVRLIKEDPVLETLTAVVTPVQFLGGIAENPENSGSRTFFATGFVPADQARMQRWNEYGVGEALENTALDSEEISRGVIGLGFARYLGLCEALHLADCPNPPESTPQRGNGEVASLPAQDFSALAEPGASAPKTPHIDLMAATSGGAPNIVTLNVGRVEKQGSREMDDGYVVMNLKLAQQLVYGRGERRVTGIILQLRRSEDVEKVRARLNDLIGRRHLNLEVRDFREINAYYGQTENFFRSMFSFIAVLIGIVVLFTVSNTMSMNVMERIDEIGTTRALGVRRGRIRSQFLLEGSMLGILGASLGVLFAFAAAAAVNHSGLSWTPPGDAHAIPLKLYLLGASATIGAVWLLLILAATFAAFVPANRAARLPIVDALRHV
ncbi:MAG TPA: FtsX-like permease family protein [Steroidobacteraceae bacterium]|nr:FtsX-like permease family protein [Steroidobacteraceae bacterium]